MPLICKDWAGTHHVDLGGNVMFLSSDSVDEIKRALLKITEDTSLYLSMKKIAQKKAIDYFSYSNIAKRAIESIS